MAYQRLVMRLAQHKHIPHVQLQPYLRQLLAQLPYSKRHIRYLLLGQESRMVALIRMVVWVFVHEALLREALVRLRFLHWETPIVFLEEGMYEALRLLAHSARAYGRSVCGYERGFATTYAVLNKFYLVMVNELSQIFFSRFYTSIVCWFSSALLALCVLRPS